MKFAKIILSIVLSSSLFSAQIATAQPKVQSSSTATASTAKVLTLEDYLNQVKSQSPEIRGLIQEVTANELRLREADLLLSPEFYSKYELFDNRAEPVNDFTPSRTQATGWRAGVRDQTLWGLGADLYVGNTHTELGGVDPNFIPLADYNHSVVGLQLTQSLWRNGFGEAARGDYEAAKARSRIAYLQSKFQLKNLLTKAENTYWSLVSFNEIVKLQEENVDRAVKLRQWMNRRAGMRLVDDVDALQAQASAEQRELELMQSLDERAALMREFNTLRGVDSDEVQALTELPTSDFLLKMVKDPNQKMTREDFAILYEQAIAAAAIAKSERSKVRPQLDLVAGVNSNGLDPQRSEASSEAYALENPTWNVGVTFSIPLDYTLLADSRRSSRAQRKAAEDKLTAAKFNEERAWDNILKQRQEAQRRFEKSTSLEKTQTQLVKRERSRLMNGRSTTFQSLTIEQNLASAQVQRVRAQLALLQIHNLIKEFEVAK